jgi:hypothetical protein
MSLELNEMEQLDGLAMELAEAGRVARVALARRERPEPAFAVRLRGELVADPCFGPTDDRDAATALMAPTRPVDAAGMFVERRQHNRPFVEELRVPSPEDGGAPAYDRVDTSRSGKRWTASGNAIPAEYSEPAGSAEDAGRKAALRPSMHWRIPTRAMPHRWIAAGLAASVAVATLLYGSGVFSTVRVDATATDAVSTTLVRGGTAGVLAAGAGLHEGDEVQVAAGGRATLALGATIVRLDAGADLQIDSLDPNHEAVTQLAGRAYHRVSVPAGGDYRVVTASVTWEAHGTAFDIERSATGGGGEQVRGLALQHDVALNGPSIQTDVREGTSATVQLRPDGSPGGSPSIDAITSRTLAEQWLVGNAAFDARLGLPLGLLAEIATPAPTVTPAPPTDEPVVTVTDEPVVTPAPTPVPTPQPTPVPTPRPTPKPTAKPTATGPANLGTLNVSKNGDGSYSFSWPRYTGSGFSYYKLVHGPWGTQPNYPAAPYWACNSPASANSWSGAIDPGDYAVRVQVVDESKGTVIRAQTNTVHLTVTAAATLPPTVDLGALTATDNGDGTYTFNWTQYTGGSFSYYKLVYAMWPGNPSYPTGSPYWAVPPAGSGSWGPITVVAGDYAVRVQAIGYPTGHSSGYAYGQTAVLHLTVPPAATPTPSPTPTPGP